MKWPPYCLPQGGDPPWGKLYLTFHIISVINHQSSIISHQSSIINHQSSMINDQSIVSTHQSSIFSRHAVITFFLTCMRFFLDMHFFLGTRWSLFYRHSVINFFLTCNVGATGWEPSDIIEDPREGLERVGKPR